MLPRGLPSKLVAASLCLILAAAIVAGGWVLWRRPSAPVHPVGPIQFHDVTATTGIRFVHHDGSSGQRYIVETITAGLALFDYDGDGDEDIYFLDGAALPGVSISPPPKNSLYRNEGDWIFTDVTDSAGVGDRGYGLGVAAADYDNDGDLDLYVNNYGPNVLYRNNGDGTFVDATNQAGVACGKRVGAGVCWLDIDRDGDLDLYVANYVQFTYEDHMVRMEAGFPTYVSPRGYAPEPDFLYRNNGDGTFADVSQESGIGQVAGSSMGMVCADFDRDGDTDIFVLNDVDANFLFVNDGSGHFEERGLSSGLAYNAFGEEMGSMGVDCADYDNDGLLDCMMTTYQGELPVLYRNLGDGMFEDATVAANAGNGAFAFVNWGTGLVDFENDGDRDLFVACGHLQDNIELFDDSTAYEVANIVLQNTGDGRFRNVSETAGDGLQVVASSRGAAFGDLDKDGDIDAVIVNSRRLPTMLENQSPAVGHWLDVRLKGTKASRDGVGAQVRVVVGDRTLTDEVHSGRSYQSHYGTALHFGLGDRQAVDRVEVDWIGGGTNVVENVEADRVLTIIEGQVP